MNTYNKLTTLIMFMVGCATAWALPSVTPSNLQTSTGVTTSVVGNTLTVTAPNRAILSWQNFGSGTDSIAAGETITYSLPSAASSVLNVVGGGNGTRVDGIISSNGNIFILNPNGIVIGNGSRVDVNSLVLSTSDNVAFASFYYQSNGKLPSQDKLTGAAGSITVNGGSVATKEGLHLYSQHADISNLIAQGNLVVNADGSVFLGSAGTTYVSGDVTVINPKGNTSLTTTSNGLIVSNNITINSTSGGVVSSATGTLNAKKLTVDAGTGVVSIGKTNATDVTVAGSNVAVAIDAGVTSAVNVTANGTVAVSTPGFLTVNLTNTGTGDNTVSSGGTLTIGNVNSASTGNTTFTGSSVTDSKNNIVVYGPVAFNANGGNVAITRTGHSFGPVSVNSVGEATVTESGALNINRVVATRFTGVTEDFIFQTPVTGAINAANLHLTATGNVTVDAAANLYTNVAVAGANVAIGSVGPVTLGNVTANGTLAVKSGTFITQAADTKVTATGNVTIAGTTATLSNAGNQFGALTVDVGTGTAAITEDSTLNLVSLKAGTAALKSLEAVITTGTGSVVADTFNIIAGTDFVPTAVLKATNPLTVLAGKTADLSLLSLVTNLSNKAPTVVATAYKAPQP